MLAFSTLNILDNIGDKFKMKKDIALNKWNKKKASQSLFDHNNHKINNNILDHFSEKSKINECARLIVDGFSRGINSKFIAKCLLNKIIG